MVEEPCLVDETVCAESEVASSSSDGSGLVVTRRRALKGGGDALLKEKPLRAVSDEKHRVALGGVRALQGRMLGCPTAHGGQGEHGANKDHHGDSAVPSPAGDFGFR